MGKKPNTKREVLRILQDSGKEISVSMEERGHRILPIASGVTVSGKITSVGEDLFFVGDHCLSIDHIFYIDPKCFKK